MSLCLCQIQAHQTHYCLCKFAPIDAAYSFYTMRKSCELHLDVYQSSIETIDNVLLGYVCEDSANTLYTQLNTLLNETALTTCNSDASNVICTSPNNNNTVTCTGTSMNEDYIEKETSALMSLSQHYSWCKPYDLSFSSCVFSMLLFCFPTALLEPITVIQCRQNFTLIEYIYHLKSTLLNILNHLEQAVLFVNMSKNAMTYQKENIIQQLNMLQKPSVLSVCSIGNTNNTEQELKTSISKLDTSIQHTSNHIENLHKLVEFYQCICDRIQRLTDIFNQLWTRHNKPLTADTFTALQSVQNKLITKNKQLYNDSALQKLNTYPFGFNHRVQKLAYMKRKTFVIDTMHRIVQAFIECTFDSTGNVIHTDCWYNKHFQLQLIELRDAIACSAYV